MAVAAAPPSVLAEPRSAPLPTVATIAAERSACILDPLAFFCSWNGVLTLAYEGFPPPLVATKAALSEFFTVCHANALAHAPFERQGENERFACNAIRLHACRHATAHACPEGARMPPLSTGKQALPKENPGSRWPKTSLGALKDGARLTPDQLDKLNAICK